LNRFLSRQQLTPQLAAKLRRAGAPLSPGAFVLLVGVNALVLATVGAMFIGLLGGALGAGIGVYIPWAWLRWREQRRIDQFDEQLPAAIDMLVSALRTGYSFHVASNFLGHELAAPLGPEFSRIYDEQRLGIDPDTALLNMQERVGSVEMRMFVTALLIQRKTGGNLGEVLSNTADLMRERMDVKRQLDTLTAEATWSGRLLTLLPVVTYFGLRFITPEFMQGFTDSSTGRYMLGGSAVAVVLGYITMMKIAQVDF
jgi:tight adherence protein B